MWQLSIIIYKCFSLISVVKPINQLTFYVEDDEVFTPGSMPGVLFTIHSPYEEVNPFEDGIFMKPGRLYKIYIEMVN